MALVIDASVLANLLCEEAGTSRARSVIIREPANKSFVTADARMLVIAGKANVNTESIVAG